MGNAPVIKIIIKDGESIKKIHRPKKFKKYLWFLLDL